MPQRRILRRIRRPRPIVAIKRWLTLARFCDKAMQCRNDPVTLIQPFVNNLNPKARLKRRPAA